MTPKFPLIPYAEALRKYGTDKPDLRNPIEMQDVAKPFRGSGFKIFARILESAKAAVWAIPRQGRRQARLLRPDEFLGAGRGAAGARLYFLARRRGRRRRPGRQEFRPGSAPTTIADAARHSKYGDACSLSPASRRISSSSPARRAPKSAKNSSLIAQDRFDLCWIVDFPMYEWNEEDKKIDFSHNPFSMPNLAVEEFLALDANDEDKILALKAIQYDIVCNGVELSSGAIRNHRPEVMKKAFAIAGYD